MLKLANNLICIIFMFSVSFSFADVTQNTKGDCSPNINEISGNVTIDCGTKIYGSLQNKGYKKSTSNLPKVKYYIDNKTDLYKSLSANVNGQTYNIISEKNKKLGHPTFNP